MRIDGLPWTLPMANLTTDHRRFCTVERVYLPSHLLHHPRSTFSRRSCHAARAALKPGLTAQLPGDCRGGAAGARSGFGEALPASHAGGSAQARSCWRRLLSPLRARCPRAHPPPRPPPFQVPQQPGHGCRCGSLASTTWTPHIPVAFRKPTVGPYPGPGLPGPWVRGTYRPQPPAHV